MTITTKELRVRIQQLDPSATASAVNIAAYGDAVWAVWKVTAHHAHVELRKLFEQELKLEVYDFTLYPRTGRIVFEVIARATAVKKSSRTVRSKRPRTSLGKTP